jgi:integrase
VFGIEKYKIDRKTECSCVGGPKREKDEDSDRCTECKHLIRGKAAATINRELTMMKHLFNKALKWKKATINPMVDVELYKEHNARTRHLTDQEAARLLAACNADFRIVVLAAMLTGFRRSELRSLRWKNVDFVNGSLTVESGYAKNGETGTVPLHPDLAKVLRELHDDRKPKPDDPVLVNRYNKPWRSWRTAFENACKREGVTDFRFHDLRHCFGSWLAKNGTDIKARMELMRHKTPSMTLRYSHLSVEYKRSAVDELPSFSTIEAESQQISQQPESKKVVAFGK